MKSLSSPLGLLALWAVLIIALMVLRPRPNTGLFWMLLIPAFCAGGLYMWLSRRDSRRLIQEWSAWELRFKSLVDVNDIEDDGHLYEWLDPPDWEKVFLELERMPPGSRNLRVAISAVDPEFLREDA